MIPPRHRPFFDRKYPSQDAPTATKDVTLHSYDVGNSLYHRTPTETMNWAINSVDKKSLYSDHVIRRRAIDVSKKDNCTEFVKGNSERREFYSPNYPGNYTKKTECRRVLEGRNLFLCICFFSGVYVLAFLKLLTAKIHLMVMV
jgi:hypothetical protein